jgi:hypothetical protein
MSVKLSTRTVAITEPKLPDWAAKRLFSNNPSVTVEVVRLVSSLLFKQGRTDDAIWVCMHGWLVPIQAPVEHRTLNTIDHLVHMCIDTKQIGTKALYYKDDDNNNVNVVNDNFLWDMDDDRKTYPLKSFTAASTKVNVMFRDIFKSVSRYDAQTANWWRTNYRAIGEMANDEASGWLVWLYSVSPYMEELARFVVLHRQDHKGLKSLSEHLKGLGLCSIREGASLAELTVLRGRGVDIPDPNKDVFTRINKDAFLREKAAVLDSVRLRACVREVLKREMGTSPIWGSKEDFWARRWLTTKAGAHSQYFEPAVFGQKLGLEPQSTRREFAEACRTNMVAYGQPVVEAGLSWKLEQGKTRAIYSCDTRSYYTFDYLLGPVERGWRNKTVLLNPGAVRDTDLYSGLAKAEGLNLMLDYDDFNSQHTLEAMKIVIEEATVGAPEDVRQWAIESLDNMFVHWHDGVSMRRERMVGTLPSGHRATTFINTVLNAAYIMCVADLRACTKCFHTGDDVVIVGPSDAVQAIMRAVHASVLRTNPSKQGIGETGEFLRVAFDKKGARGYLARAVASLVSGNWVTEAQGSVVSGLSAMLGCMWNVSLRSSNRDACACLYDTFLRRFPCVAAEALDICRFQVSVNGSPIWTDGQFGGLMLVVREGALKSRSYVSRPHYATQDFLAKFVDFKKMEVRKLGVQRLVRLMQDASYRQDPTAYRTPTVSYQKYGDPLGVNPNYVLGSGSRVQPKGAEAALLRLVRTPEERAVFRLLFSQQSEASVDAKPALNDGTLPCSTLQHIARRLGSAVYVRTAYPVMK